jgi:indolepyruvate ferredoxin oxidoreductase alpha subunit
LDGRDGFALGDIGCYALGVQPTGYEAIQTVHSMGSGIGLASGFGKLGDLGFEQPTVAVIGDSTLFHAGIPPLLNALTTGAAYLCIVLDNDTTAMTGHQPHPGSGFTAMGDTTSPIPIVELLKRLDIPVTVRDPYRVQETTDTILALLQQKGLQVLVLQRECALKAGRSGDKPRVTVDPNRCLGDACGCSRLCSRVFSCPANIWDDEAGKAAIDDVLCTGCGVCAAVCPEGAIIVEQKGGEGTGVGA